MGSHKRRAILARWISGLSLLSIWPGSLPAQDDPNSPKAIIDPAIDRVFAGFKTHPIVGLGDDHGLAQAEDFYATVIRDPRFAKEVGNVVIEFGASGQQSVADRYVNGETVPYSELRKIWTDTVGWTPTAGILGFAKFLAAVRQTNKGFPAAQRIHVWLGEPPVDWPTATREQVLTAFTSRDSHPAQILDREILAKKKKALVIYGSFHFGADQVWLRGKVEAKYPGSFYAILGSLGIEQNRPGVCAPLLAQLAKVWPRPAAVSAIPTAARDPVVQDCLTLKPQPSAASTGAFVIGPGAPPRGSAPATFRPTPLLAIGEAVLFVAPREKFTQSPFLPDYALDPAYRREIARRATIGGQALIRFPPNYRFRKADFAVDLDAPGYNEALDTMFGTYDKDGDGVVTAAEYVDPVP